MNVSLSGGKILKNGFFIKNVKGGAHMFSGEYQHSVDTKGRVIIPLKFREQLGNTFCITRGLDGNLLIYSNSAWENVYQKLSTLPMINKESRAFSRYLTSGCTEVETDRQGRILIPQSLRTHANITKDVTIIGNGDKVEIWDTQLWNNSLNAIDPDQLAEKMSDLGIII